MPYMDCSIIEMKNFCATFLLYYFVNITFAAGLQEESWVTVVTVSEWYHDMFENWLYWFQQLSIDMTVVLIAEDDETFEKYYNTSFMKVLMKDKSQVFTGMVKKATLAFCHCY